MSLEIWIMSVSSCIAIVIGGWIMITHIFPIIETMIKPVIKDKKSLGAFMALLNIVILWMVAQGIVIYLLRIDNVYLNYLDIFSAGLDVFLEFLPYLKWVILGWFLILALKKR